MNTRHTVTLLVFILILAFPYWMYVPFLFGATAYFDLYLEALPLAFLADVLYGATLRSHVSLVFPCAIGVCALLVIMVPLRSQLRLN